MKTQRLVLILSVLMLTIATGCGDENGTGLIGGKAGGNLLGERILTRAQDDNRVVVRLG